jgi:hypothetical protein
VEPEVGGQGEAHGLGDEDALGCHDDRAAMQGAGWVAPNYGEALLMERNTARGERDVVCRERDDAQ